MSSPNTNADAGTGAAAVPAPSPWRPLIVRTVLGAIALLGLSGIGAFSMLAGLDGAHASPPAASSVSAPATANGAAGSPQLPNPAASSAAAFASPSATNSTGEPTAACPASTDDGRVILNLAGPEDLRKLPGIGPKRAEAILQLRAKLKRFKRGSDLLRVRGIGPKSLARMQPHFVVDPPIGSVCAGSAAAIAR